MSELTRYADLERALTDEEFRQDLKDALSAARELYGPLTKSNGVA